MIEVQKLIQPVSAENPAGESLRYSQIYDSIKSARREDDDLPQGVWQKKLKKADWEEVKSICLDALENRSKDLQIGSWLLEACIHLDGFAGVNDGFRVLTALCENFWETLYPVFDPEEPEYRYGPISWIDEKLTLTLKLIPITQPKAEDGPSYAWGDWERALHQTRVAAKQKAGGKKPAADGGSLQAKFMSSVSLTPNEFFIELKRQLATDLTEVDRFERMIVRFDNTQEGALHHMREMLEGIHHFVGEVLAGRGADIVVPPEVEARTAPSIPEPEPEMTANEQIEHGPVRSRAQAYRMLAEAADYLMKTEPHSPTPYLIRRAIAWGGMSLGELLQQILRNPGELGELYRLLGLDEMLQKGKKAE